MFVICSTNISDTVCISVTIEISILHPATNGSDLVIQASYCKRKKGLLQRKSNKEMTNYSKIRAILASLIC